MGFRRIQKAQSKKRLKDKEAVKKRPQKQLEDPRDYRKYKNFKIEE